MTRAQSSIFQRFTFLPVAILLSIAAHILLPLILTAFSLILPRLPLNYFEQKKPKTFKVETVSPEQMKKYRTVGKKNGNKSFSLPNKIAPAPLPKPLDIKNIAAPAPTPITKSQPTNNKKISLADLAADNKVIPKSTREAKPIEKKNNTGIQITSRQSREQQIRQAQLQGALLQQAKASPAAAEVLHNKSFGMNFETPEGVDEDELNSTEKIFYSFHKRTYRAYLGSFVQTYNRLLRQKPTIRNPLQDKHRLRAKVVYDEKGNIISIRIMKSSPSDEIHDLFEETLKEMKGLPNPPKALIKKDGQFVIYYQLQINS